MPILLTSSGYGYSYKQSKVKKSFPKFIELFVVITMLIVITFFALSISNVLTNILNLDISHLFNEKILYAIKVGSYNDYQTSNVFALSLKKQGGAGFVISDNTHYVVLLSCYETKSDAIRVCENLQNNGIEADIFEMKLKSFDFSVKLTDNQKSYASQALNSFFTSYQDLYKLSIGFDSQKISKLDVIESIDLMLEKLNKTYFLFNQTCVTSENSSFVYLKVYFSQLIENIENLKTISENFSAEIKNCYIKSLDLYIRFRNEFWNKNK